MPKITTTCSLHSLGKYVTFFFFLNDCNVVSSSLYNHKMSGDILCPLIANDSS